MKIYIALLSTCTLTACLTWPQTPHEFIDKMGGDGRESIVDQPYKEVVARNNKLTEKCLNVNILHRSSGNVMNKFNPKIHEGEKSTLYSLQSNGGVDTGWPEGGMYTFTGQVIKVSDKKTKIITHAIWNLSSDELQTTFHNWSNGTSNVCPNML